MYAESSASLQVAAHPKQAFRLDDPAAYATIARLPIPFGHDSCLNMGKFFWSIHIDEAPTFRNRFGYLADINGRKFTKSKKSFARTQPRPSASCVASKQGFVRYTA